MHGHHVMAHAGWALKKISKIMRINQYIFLLVCLFLAATAQLSAQGCVAIRGNTACGGSIGNAINLSQGEFFAQAGFRYFQSFRHFRGSHEEAHRLEEGTEVINDSYFLDLSLNYGITDRLFATAIVPFVYHNRSSMYEHGGNPPNGLGERHSTSSRGISDVRLGLGYWLFDPQKHAFNYSIGLGVKLPTGKYDYMDTFYNQGEGRNENRQSVVDQSIQPGDGGTGIALEVQGFQPLSHSIMMSANVFYLFNFQETNGVLTRNGRSEFSVPDQFGVRLGAFYTHMNGFSAYLGGRVEGVPANDAIGGSAGYRRPGYAISAEPGVGFFAGKYSVFLSVPVALARNRTQSFEDKQRTLETGVYRHGDAAFADYLVNFGVAYRFGGRHDMPAQTIPNLSGN